MHVRAIALALPLVVSGIACRTTHTSSEGSAHTARAQSGKTNQNQTTSEPRTAQENTVATSPSGASTGSTATVQSGQTDRNQTTSEPRTAQENTVSSSPSGASTGSAGAAASGQTDTNVTTSEPRTSQESTASTAPYGSGTSSSTAVGSSGSMGASRDPIIEQGDPVKGHAEDNVVSGRIARVSRRAVVIESDAGVQKSLVLVPETAIEVDGQDAHRSDLSEGQEVRASFSDVNGRDVAVKIRAGEGATRASPDDPSRSRDQGSSGSLDMGAGSGSSGSTGSPSDPSSSTPHR